MMTTTGTDTEEGEVKRTRKRGEAGDETTLEKKENCSYTLTFTPYTFPPPHPRKKTGSPFSFGAWETFSMQFVARVAH